jgi:hypothetical protein
MPTSSITSSNEESDNGLPPPGSRWGRGAQSVLPYLTKTLQARPAHAPEQREPRTRDGHPVFASWTPRHPS